MSFLLHELAHAHESADNADAHLDGLLAAQYGRKHGNAVLSESKGVDIARFFWMRSQFVTARLRSLSW